MSELGRMLVWACHLGPDIQSSCQTNGTTTAILLDPSLRALSEHIAACYRGSFGTLTMPRLVSGSYVIIVL